MEEIVYHTNYKLENSYWWFIARNRIIFNLFKRICATENGSVVLDAGCGTGGFSKLLAEEYTTVGLDTSPVALNYCRKRGLENLFEGTLGDFPAEKWNPGSIIMLDVIEHIDDDSGVVRDAFEKLPPGGWLVASVPAYGWLWSHHDIVHMHYRRYTRKRFLKLLKENGFEIEFSTYMNTLLMPLAVLKRFAEKIFGSRKKDSAPVDEVPEWMNKLFRKIFLFEDNLLRMFRLPFGVTVFAIARKPK